MYSTYIRENKINTFDQYFEVNSNIIHFPIHLKYHKTKVRKELLRTILRTHFTSCSIRFNVTKPLNQNISTSKNIIALSKNPGGTVLLLLGPQRDTGLTRASFHLRFDLRTHSAPPSVSSYTFSLC